MQGGGGEGRGGHGHVGHQGGTENLLSHLFQDLPDDATWGTYIVVPRRRKPKFPTMKMPMASVISAVRAEVVVVELKRAGRRHRRREYTNEPNDTLINASKSVITWEEQAHIEAKCLVDVFIFSCAWLAWMMLCS